jgi:hypothetical protein
MTTLRDLDHQIEAIIAQYREETPDDWADEAVDEHWRALTDRELELSRQIAVAPIASPRGCRSQAAPGAPHAPGAWGRRGLRLLRGHRGALCQAGAAMAGAAGMTGCGLMFLVGTAFGATGMLAVVVLLGRLWP